MAICKICFFVPYYPLIKGGAEYQAKIIAEELTKFDYEVIYISEGHELEGQELHNGFKVYKLTTPFGTVEKATLYRRFMTKVNAIIAEENPDVIYQRILNTFTYRLSKFANKSKIPFVLHIADNYSVEFNKGYKSFFKERIFKDILKQRPYIICQTDYQKQKIRQKGYEPAAKIPNMHPDIRVMGHEQKDKNSIVWIGNSRPVKQLEVFLKLAKDFESTNFLFHVIGKIPESEYGFSLQEKLKVATNVEYHGEKTNAYINSFLIKSGLLVNTSASEGFSNTFIQAWMCGTPVLAFNSDPDGIMKKYAIGIDCKGSYSDLSKGLLDILESDDYGSWCERALATATSLFSTSENISKFTSVLKTAINGRK
ncbi:glycosyltransferase family 4 protein [Flavobacteriaceae bacterium TP-CH-4]|uniref:Glycosyltransferase family 4 protein n=1 Tax=Pelagihabitans pacificus TaxID=2696054 RepID=A0A967AXQ8_9FLAO|nr:glycosyltransferase family 4 protein [Pelagihabitans pacificus]NHF61078.1 glycosyltransferase family 4 protein [Pelagihabitans pacificus]